MGDITEAFVKQYADNFILLSQQKKSRLEQAVRLESGIVGGSKSVDAVGSVTARKRTTRNEDSPLIKTPFSRRWLDLADYDWGDLLDDQDKIKMLVDPTSSVVQTGVASLNRAKDQVILDAMRGSARAEVGGAVALPAGQKVAVGGTGLTLAKLITAKELLAAAEGYNEDDPNDQLYIAVAARQLSDLLGTTEVKSVDYNTVKALVAGTVDTFMGFKFIRTQLVNLTTAVRYCTAWCKSGMVLGVGKDIKTEVTLRADKSFATYPYAAMSLGAVRTEEVKVVEIACAEA